MKPGAVQSRVVQKLRAKAPLVTATYVAYAAMEQLIKECSRPGEYKIPQALEKNGEIPTDETGTHIGEGEGWWYSSMHCHNHYCYATPH